MTKIAIVADFLEEKWPSMDLVAEELAAHLSALPGVQSQLIRPPLRTTLNASAPAGLERALGRFAQLPLELVFKRVKADFFHIADHSYAHLALLFPTDRVGVYCHDIDAFRALLPGSGAPLTRWALSKLLLRGLRHARVVFHSTQVVRDEIVRQGLVPESRLVHAPYGVASEFLNAPSGGPTTPPYLLHVGSCVPRKNIDFLLRVFARVRELSPQIELVQVGGTWTETQKDIIEEAQIGAYLVQKRGISRSELAKLYASAAAVLVPSRAEGFGLPIIESVACGAPVIASDIAVLREVGLQGVRFCSPVELEQWVATITDVVESGVRADQVARRAISSRYTWTAHAQAIANAYSAREFRSP